MTTPDPVNDPVLAHEGFVTTHWNVVWRAREQDPAASLEAREKLCRTYWPPLYAYIRRAGYGIHDAQDLTQEFLTQFLHKEWLNHLQDQRGKFRSFLLTFLKNFLSDQRDRANAQKRGGGQRLISLDAYDAEEREFVEPADRLTPEEIFELRWAQALMAQAVGRLHQDYVARGKAEIFEQLKDLQWGEHGERNYTQIGTELGMTEQAMKNAALTFRRRCAQLVRDEIAQTVIVSSEISEELQHLMDIFSR